MRGHARAGRRATAFASSRTPRTPSARSYQGQPVGSALRRRHRVQLPPGQDHHHRRRRHGHHQRRRAGAAPASCCARTASRAMPAQMDARRPKAPGTTSSIELGYNYRMTDLQAALGCSQLQRLDGYVARRATRWPRATTGCWPACRCACRAPGRDRPLGLAPVRGRGRRRSAGAAARDGVRRAARGRHRRQRALHPDAPAAVLPALRLPPGRLPGGRGLLRAGACRCRCFPGMTEAEQDRVVAVLAQVLAG